MVARIAGEGLSLLIVEQFAHEVLRIADVAALLVNGRIVFRGSPADVNEALESAISAAPRSADEVASPHAPRSAPGPARLSTASPRASRPSGPDLDPLAPVRFEELGRVDATAHRQAPKRRRNHRRAE